jgi:hypothetical protein
MDYNARRAADCRSRSPDHRGGIAVERNHGTHQDRLVKKLRRRKIATHGAVNQYLEADYCDDHNQRFAVAASSEVDCHLPAGDRARAGQRLSGAA